MSAARDPSFDDAAWAELPLEPRHVDELKRSAITPAVAKARGYRTVTKQSELAKEGFGRNQQLLVPGLLIPSTNLSSGPNYPAFKPDSPRLFDGKICKYEWPGKSTSQLDVPVRVRQWANNPQFPIVFVEGHKKADGLASHEVCGIGIGGCWNWRSDDVIATLDQLRLKGRNAYLCPDPDWRRNPKVRTAWLRLGRVLKQRGAVVLLIAMPDDLKVDDFFAAGGNVLKFWNFATEMEELEESDPEADKPIAVRSIIPSAPVSEEAVIPPGYAFTDAGIEYGGNLVASAPIVETARLIHVDDHSESVRLAWPRDGRWIERVVGREVVSNARELVGLASHGLSVTSRTAGDVVDYLATYEATNLHVMPRASISDRFGWQGRNGDRGFLIGRNLIRGDGTSAGEINLEEVAPSDWREDWIAFQGDNEGASQLASAFSQSGDFESWVRAIESIQTYPRVMLAVYASLATPLLSLFGASNFVIDWSFPTSTGKTTSLRVGASVWGNPNERVDSSLVGTWDSTRVYVERTAAILNGLPLILDDTKQAKYPKVVAQSIYDVVSGRGRGRGSTQGTRKSGSWSTILLSSGEAPATSFTEDGGTRARTLVLWGLPFGRADFSTGAIVNRLNLSLRANYGHAGPRLVRHLLEHRDQWDAWRSEFRQIESDYLDRAGDDPVAGRLAGYFAILDMASLLTHDAMELSWEYKDPIEALWSDLIHEAKSADRAKDALALVMSWAQSNQHTFDGRLQQDDNYGVRIPLQGVSGRWERGDDWSSIAFFPHKLKDLLTDGGFDSDSIVRTWRDRDWLELDNTGRHYTKRIRIDGELTRALVIKRSASEVAE